MTHIFEIPTPICLFKIQLLWSYDEDYGHCSWENVTISDFWSNLWVCFWDQSQPLGANNRLNIILDFSNPRKTHPCSKPHLLNHCAKTFVRGSDPYIIHILYRYDYIYIIIAMFTLIFRKLPRIPRRADWYQIWHTGSSLGTYQLWQALCKSIRGFWFCARSNFVKFGHFLLT